jgi:hypothetical protein
LVKLTRQAVIDKHVKSISNCSTSVLYQVNNFSSAKSIKPQVTVTKKSELEIKDITRLDFRTIDNIIKDETLNDEQTQAFRIVAKHCCKSVKD